MICVVNTIVLKNLGCVKGIVDICHFLRRIRRAPSSQRNVIIADSQGILTVFLHIRLNIG